MAKRITAATHAMTSVLDDMITHTSPILHTIANTRHRLGRARFCGCTRPSFQSTSCLCGRCDDYVHAWLHTSASHTKPSYLLQYCSTSARSSIARWLNSWLTYLNSSISGCGGGCVYLTSCCNQCRMVTRMQQNRNTPHLYKPLGKAPLARRHHHHVLVTGWGDVHTQRPLLLAL